ncbi:MAG TPA: hypothetical protein VKT28_01775 [Puia sp.]|nr:hypothetical protein [Puia sp.]
MKKILSIGLLLSITSVAMSQVIGTVEKKTKEFYIKSNQNKEYRVFGYAYPNVASQKLICFSSYAGDVTANANGCPLGAYYDTGRMKITDKITYIATLGNFGKMLFTSSSGKKAIFYLPKSSFVIK